MLVPGERVAAAVSGGADSVALLRLLLAAREQLGIVLSVAHFNHNIRGAESDGDQEFVSALARSWQLEFHTASERVPDYANAHKLSLETAARELRYAFFRRLIQAGATDKVATAHTCSDQAESVLMRVIRGTGSKGMAGVYPEIDTSETSAREGSVGGNDAGGNAAIVRPLLEFRRSEIEHYLHGLHQPWRADSSNQDLTHTRNRIRHHLLPLLEREYNPRIVRVLASEAEIARADEDYWAAECSRLLPSIISSGSQVSPLPPTGPPQALALNLPALRELPLALQRRVVRAVAASLHTHVDFEHVDRLLRFAVGDEHQGAPTGKLCLLPRGWCVRQAGDQLHFERTPQNHEQASYEYLLPLPGSVLVPELGTIISATMPVREGTGGNPMAEAGRKLVVRNWQAGDRFWAPHSKAPKKIKELLQKRHLSAADRRLWPVVSDGTRILWMRGFPTSDKQPGDDDVLLEIDERAADK